MTCYKLSEEAWMQVNFNVKTLCITKTFKKMTKINFEEKKQRLIITRVINMSKSFLLHNFKPTIEFKY